LTNAPGTCTQCDVSGAVLGAAIADDARPVCSLASPSAEPPQAAAASGAANQNEMIDR
jgi:hypothetical protein